MSTVDDWRGLPDLDEKIVEIDEHGGRHLRGARCADCGATTFPEQASCPRCTGEHMTPIRLSDEGTLWSWTTQGFRPGPPYAAAGSPADHEPFVVGYVELPEGLLVESRICGLGAERPAIGMALRFTPWPFERSDGSTVLAPGFAPA